MEIKNISCSLKKEKNFPKKTVLKVIEKEISVFNTFSDEERITFLRLLSKYTQTLERLSNENTII